MSMHLIAHPCRWQFKMGQTVAVLKSYLETELELPMADTVSSVDIRAMTDARLRYEPPPI
jgi:hypothetical protein